MFDISKTRYIKSKLSLYALTQIWLIKQLKEKADIDVSPTDLSKILNGAIVSEEKTTDVILASFKILEDYEKNYEKS